MRFLYTTDLHGDEHKYNQILDYALANDYDIIHIGGDILPKGRGILEIQKKFVNGFLKKWCHRAWENDILTLMFFGNDDLYSRKKYFKAYGGNLLDENRVITAEWTFKAYPWVPVHPFGLLNGCKLDDVFREPEPFYNNPADLNETGSIVEITDYRRYLIQRGTIENDLRSLDADNHTIMAMHCPPAGLDLDVCRDGRKVGSVPMRTWIERNKPALVLCGHIHESPDVTGVWKNYTTNGTLVIQPGQTGTDAVIVEIDMDNLDGITRRVLS